MERTRRIKRRAHERWVQTRNAEHLRKYVAAMNAAKRAQEAYAAFRDPKPDTGWQLLTTTHGPRFHREVSGMELDVEPQVATWIGSAIKAKMLQGVAMGHRTQYEAAEAIEVKFGVAHRPLPALEEVTA